MRGDASRTESHSASSVSRTLPPSPPFISFHLSPLHFWRLTTGLLLTGEKAREQRDRAQRDAQNQQYAGSTYHIPAADDLMVDDGDLSGLPWGGINMRHVVARGHAASATSSHHTHSHHSSDSAVAAYRRDSGNNNANPAPGSSSIAADVVVDHALYNLNPYGGPGGYGPPATSHHAVAMGYAGDGTESSHGYYHHDSPYGGYYDYDAPPTTGPGHYPA